MRKIGFLDIFFYFWILKQIKRVPALCQNITGRETGDVTQKPQAVSAIITYGGSGVENLWPPELEVL